MVRSCASLAAAGGVAVFALLANASWRGGTLDSVPLWTVATVVVLVAGTATAAFLSVALAFGRLTRNAAGRRARRADVVLFACAFGLIAAAPVDASWSDGCNDHGASVPLVAAPYIKTAHPSNGPAYLDARTEIFCAKGHLGPPIVVPGQRPARGS